jgi:hypothetical protein
VGADGDSPRQTDKSYTAITDIGHVSHPNLRIYRCTTWIRSLCGYAS